MTTISPSQLIQGLRWRYATKQFDPTKKISPADFETLEDALVLTPSSGGLQPWAFIVVTDPAVREKLVPASYGQPQIKDASHLIVFAAKVDLEEADVDAHIERIAQVRGVSVESLKEFRSMLVGGLINSRDSQARQAWASCQVAIALGNLLTSAALLAIDACPMEGFVPAQYDSILNLTEQGLTSVALCTLGYRSSTDAYAELPKVRFPKERVIRHV